MRILYVTTVGATMSFFKDFIRQLVNEGHTVDIATNEVGYPISPIYRELGCQVHHIDTSRSPFSFGNIKAVKQIKKIVSVGGYDLVHCHTPIAAACTRIACRGVRKRGVRVLYTAHGFHFYKGAPKKNWLIFYPVEKLCARMTDVIITINREDFDLARRKLKAKRVEYIPGVGIEPERFLPTEKSALKRSEIGVPEGAKMLLSVGELNKNKNHEKVIRAIAELGKDDVHYVIAGKGDLADELTGLARDLGIAERVHILGYREDVAELYGAADLFVHPSYREGLPVAVIEAMAAGLPVVASRIRGNVDLIDEEGGRLVCPCNVRGFAEAIDTVLSNTDMSEKMGAHNREVAKNYSTDAVSELLLKLYE